MNINSYIIDFCKLLEQNYSISILKGQELDSRYITLIKHGKPVQEYNLSDSALMYDLIIYKGIVFKNRYGATFVNTVRKNNNILS